uniref:J domain-containing protein n=1 Tax=Pseudo-nitzschia australis TaxID=44445 RepID=A0A7S4EPG6_9STRA
MNRKFSYSTTAVNMSVLTVVTVSLLFLLFTGYHNCNTTTNNSANNRNLKYCSFFRIGAANAAATGTSDTTDLYKILGVKRSATVQEIKKAYRKKALDTHPDKNKNVPAEEATAAFHKVVNAFEILSDKASRNRYDRTGEQTQGGHNGHQQQGGGFQWTFKWNTHGGGSHRSRQHHYQQYQRPKLKDRNDVKESQARIMSIVSLEQLETIMTTSSTSARTDGTNENELVLERNLMICFYTPPLEKHLMDEMVYPWPFAGMSPQGIWWEDLLQTTVVRFHNSNDLTEFFGVPRGSSLKQPMFIFGRRGQKFHNREAWNRLTTDNRSVFDKWAWKQLEVEVTFVNNHDHPVECACVRACVVCDADDDDDDDDMWLFLICLFSCSATFLSPHLILSLLLFYVRFDALQ